MARQSELFRPTWMVTIRIMAEQFWKNPWFGWGLIGLFAVWYATWCFHIPSPAKAATVLGFIAAIMVFRGEPGGIEKFFWTIVLFSFLLLEIKAIDHKDYLDEVSRQMAEVRETKSFDDIGRGINNQSRLSQQQFEETVAQQSLQFDATMKKAQINIDEVTGGSSYAIVFPIFSTQQPGEFPLMIRVCEKCKYSVWDAHVYLQSNVSATDLGSLIYEGMVNPTAGVKGYAPITPQPVGETDYRIVFMPAIRER